MSSKPTPSPPLSTTTVSDEQTSILPPPLPPKRPAVFPAREDCWSEAATETLIDAWGSHYLELNRGNLRHTHWLAVADSVTAIHRRTDVQCKNRIDTIKKRFKIEKSKKTHQSTWPHFRTLDSLIAGASFSSPNPGKKNRRKISPSPESLLSPESSPSPSTRPPAALLRVPPWPVPVGPRTKRCGPGNVTKRNFLFMADAAAAVEADDDAGFSWKMRRVEEKGNEGYRVLAEAIGRLGMVYERVELQKHRQMVELEKQRMLFFRDLEMLRMEFFMESQVLLEKL